MQSRLLKIKLSRTTHLKTKTAPKFWPSKYPACNQLPTLTQPLHNICKKQTTDLNILNKLSKTAINRS